MTIIEVKTRDANNTHYARAVGQNLQCTCTAGRDQSVDALKCKYFPKAITKKVTPNSPKNRDRLSKSITHLLILK